jgi:hypothetical protein
LPILVGHQFVGPRDELGRLDNRDQQRNRHWSIVVQWTTTTQPRPARRPSPSRSVRRPISPLGWEATTTGPAGVRGAAHRRGLQVRSLILTQSEQLATAAYLIGRDADSATSWPVRTTSFSAAVTVSELPDARCG